MRQLVRNAVAYNETDYRPLGPLVGGEQGGAARQATFDVEAFAKEHPAQLHNIPLEHAGSRLWTCAVKDWTRTQTRATREANRAAEATGVSRETQTSKAPSRDKVFEQLLAKDPVWQKIIASREKKGPQPAGDRQGAVAVGHALHAAKRESWGQFKILQAGSPERLYESEQKVGGSVPPWFNLAGCQDCTAGAAYGKSRDGYPLDTPGLICTNQACYEKKLAGDEGVYREEVEAQLKDTDSQDSQAIQALMGRLALLSRRDLRTPASSLIAAQPALELHHVLGVPHKKWSYKTTAVKFISGMLTHKPARCDRYDRGSGIVVLDLEFLDAVPDNDLLELTASLMAHHLRQAGKLETTEASHA